MVIHHQRQHALALPIAACLPTNLRAQLLRRAANQTAVIQTNALLGKHVASWAHTLSLAPIRQALLPRVGTGYMCALTVATIPLAVHNIAVGVAHLIAHHVREAPIGAAYLLATPPTRPRHAPWVVRASKSLRNGAVG